MTPRPALAFLGASIAIFVAGAALVVRATVGYLTNWHPVSSSSGDYVYRFLGELHGYPRFVVGHEPMLVALGLALVVIAVAIAALTWRPAS